MERSPSKNYVSKRVSLFDRTGGNRAALTIKPGETAVLAELAGVLTWAREPKQ